MNKGKLKKNLWQPIRLRPKVTYKGQEYDGQWLFEQINDKVEIIILRNTAIGNSVTLGFDHILNYDSDPMNNGDGLRHGFLILKVQISITDSAVEIEPLPPNKLSSK